MDPSRHRRRSSDNRPTLLTPILPSPIHTKHARTPSPPRSIQKRPRTTPAFPTPSTSTKTNTTVLVPAVCRDGLTKPARTVKEVIAPFIEFAPRTPEEKMDAAKLDGMPKLSCMALSVARIQAQRGLIMDLSKVADDHVFMLFGTNTLTPGLLSQIEACNPWRVNVMEALWARLVVQTFETTTLPKGIDWWRECFEKLTQEREVELQRSSERLRRWYSDGDRERQKRTIEKTRRISVVGGRKKRTFGGGGSSPGVQSRISRLREEVRREKRRR